MLTFPNIDDFIDYLPKFMIPYDYFDICWYVKIKNNENFNIITPKEVIYNLKRIFGNFNNPNRFYTEKLNNYINFLRKDSRIKILRTGKILFDKEYIPEDLIQCDNCGNIWDGNAQCDCYLYSNEFGEYMCLM